MGKSYEFKWEKVKFFLGGGEGGKGEGKEGRLESEHIYDCSTEYSVSIAKSEGVARWGGTRGTSKNASWMCTEQTNAQKRRVLWVAEGKTSETVHREASLAHVMYGMNAAARSSPSRSHRLSIRKLNSSAVSSASRVSGNGRRVVSDAVLCSCVPTV